MSPALLVVPACVVFGTLAVVVRGRRRGLPAGLAACCVAYAIVATQVPVSLGEIGYAPGLNIVPATAPPGSGETLWYELAPAGGQFSVGLTLIADGPFPVRVEGIRDPAFGREPYYGIVWMAVWIDREPNGGMMGPGRPFAPFELQHSAQSIWLVGRAGACALGPAFDPAGPGAGLGGFGGLGDLEVRVSVLGWPRTIHLEYPFRLVEPDPDTCPSDAHPGASPAPSARP